MLSLNDLNGLNEKRWFHKHPLKKKNPFMLASNFYIFPFLKNLVEPNITR